MQKLIYLDNAAATPMDPRVFEAMRPYFTENYANPSSIYRFAQRARAVVDEAREDVGRILQCAPRDILFTSGGTESNNMILFGVAFYADDKKLPVRHIITTKIEHDSVLKPVEYLESKGFEITRLDVGDDGIVEVEDVKKAMRKDTLLVSIMYANNEIGTIQPIPEIGAAIREFRAANKAGGQPVIWPIFHTDACQAAPYLSLSTQELGVDAMTFSGEKIYGPKGIGVLYCKENVPFVPMMMGGGQEYRKRSGTENVPAIAGFAKALVLAQEERAQETARLMSLRDFLINGILKNIPDSRLNGDSSRRLPNNINVSFRGLEGEAILLQLDMIEVAASAGSACTSGSLEPSHVIRALGLSEEWTHSATRFTLGRGNKKEELETVLQKLPKIIKELREFSPFSASP